MNKWIFIGGVLDRNIVMNVVRSLVAFIDSIILSLVSTVFNLLFAIANFSSSPAFKILYDKIISRIYVIVGIVVLFKVLMSLISYLANPDKLTDKEQGAGKLVTRIVTSLILLIAVPQIVFPMLDRLQGPLLETVSKVIMGNNINTSNAGFGDTMALSLFTTFFTSNDKCESSEAVNSTMNTILELPILATEACPSDKNLYRYDFFMFISTTFYLIVVVLLLIIGIDLAIRSFKLLVLKILAPIPILSYISPKSAKEGMFASYVKLFSTTWLDLFIKFAVIYLGFAFIQAIIDGELVVNVASGLITTGLGSVFLIIGAIIFMFQAPKFIKKALNLKDAEFGTGVAGLLGLGATTAGMVGSGVASYRGSKDFVDENGNKHTTVQNVAAGLAGALGGGITGAKVAMGKDASIGKVMEALNKRNAQTLAMSAAGSTFGGRTRSTLQSFFTGQNAADIGKRKIENLEAFNKSLDAIGSRVKSEMVKSDKTAGEFIKGSGLRFNYKEFMAAKNAAASAGASTFTVTNQSTGNMETVSMRDAELNGGYLLKTNEDDYIQKVLSNDPQNRIDDAVLSAQIADAEAKAVSVSDADVTRDYFDRGKFTVSGRDSVKKTQDAITRDVISEKRANAKAEADARFSHKK